jgi:hypothetical protein
MFEPKRIVLDELRRTFSAVYSASDVLDSKLQSNFNYSSVIVSGISVIITIASRNTVGFWYWVFLFLGILLYGIMFIRIRQRIKPTQIAFPISTDMETLREKYFDERITEERALDQAILDYSHYIEQVLNSNKLKADGVNTSSWLMFCVVIALLFAALFGIVLPSLGWLQPF